ncbi:MAG: septation protein IspZ [Bradyrhizobium sp.]|uniref:inner membrane-spanning protein YciB n=1 Tax=Bradyrhizobium sp. TaxID=376 RepID=UPI001D6FA56F|nr:septation protein IspZ [Bradyrhizobium sp.]MBV9563674.1 septation protein IspZ [Bradyrhizobium sp.]
MRDFLNGVKFLLLDLGSTILFVGVFLLTHNTYLAIGLGIAMGLTQIGLQLARGRPIATMEWLSLFLVVAAGMATLLTDDPRFVLFKPSVIYLIVGIVMLKPGWLNRYLPAIAQQVVPDIAAIVGLLWAGLMFVSALVNAVVATSFDIATWALVMPVFGIVSKAIVFLLGFALLRFVARRRVLAMPPPEREALLASTGRR